MVLVAVAAMGASRRGKFRYGRAHGRSGGWSKPASAAQLAGTSIMARSALECGDCLRITNELQDIYGIIPQSSLLLSQAWAGEQ